VYKVFSLVVISILMIYVNPIQSYAEFPFFTDEIGKWLIVGNGPVNVAQTVNTNNFEFGANKAPVPSNSDCGPTLLGAVPNLPGNILPVFSGISGDGNIAVIMGMPDGVYDLQDVGVFADLGIHTAGPLGTFSPGTDAGTSESYFNDPNYPNTFDGVADCTFIDDADKDSTMLIDDNVFAGVTGDIDFTALKAELFGPAGASTLIPSLMPPTDTLDVSSGIPGSASQGVIESTTVTINLMSGLNVIDVVTGGGVDFLLSNSNLVIQGPENSAAIIRIPDDANFIISNGNVLAGDGGIGLNSIVFYSDNELNEKV